MPHAAKMLELNVRPEFSCRVLFTGDFLAQMPAALRQAMRPIDAESKLLTVVDTGLIEDAAFMGRLGDGLDELATAFGIRPEPPVLVPGGETSKNNPIHLEALYEAIYRSKLCRHSYLLVIGGGAVLDVAGYAAATAHRGIRLVRVPTTVLAQADSGVSVKNGINYFGRKNFLGTFSPPRAVINDQRLLRTLCDRDWRAGIAEAVKVAVIKDADFFGWIEQHVEHLLARDEIAMGQLIYRSAALHMEHIGGGGDPFEQGSARPLDFGHWAAHKLEQLTDYRLRHGEAVAIGMALDASYAAAVGMLRADVAERLIALLAQLQLPVTLPEDAGADDLLEGIEEFREHLGGRLSITLPTTLGECVEIQSVDAVRMRQCIEKMLCLPCGQVQNRGLGG
jgi:3-dehydroquinate synthase